MQQQSILFGNGFNLLSPGTQSWDALVNSISSLSLNNDIPNTLKYEAIILANPYERGHYLSSEDGHLITTEDGKKIIISSENTEHSLKETIGRVVKSFQTNDAYKYLANIKADNYLTTNYDNTLIKTIGEGNLKETVLSEKIYSIRRKYIINNNGQDTTIWPIHGNIDTPASIMLGFDHYCGALNKIESYIKGTYDMPGHGIMKNIKERLKEGINKPLSWIDLFFTTDLHIIGIGLSFEETDLWWLLNKRARMIWSDSHIFNHIYYYPIFDMPKDIRQMLQQFNVEIIDPSPKRSSPLNIYLAQLEKINEKINKARV